MIKGAPALAGGGALNSDSRKDTTRIGMVIVLMFQGITNKLLIQRADSKK